MLTGILFVLLVLCAGYLGLRGVALAKGATAGGLAPAAGLALTSVVATWCGLPGAPVPVAGVLVLACGLGGLALAIVDREELAAAAKAFARQETLAVVLLAAALLVPIASMGIAFVQIQAPLSPHDGAFHVETSEAFRRSIVTATWYPPGLAALFGAVLQLMPWVDTAAGAFGLGLGLSLLAPLAVFGLGAAVFRNLVAAATGALLVSLTHLFLYYPQIWSGWPQLLGILLVIGLWLVAISYMDRPGWRTASAAGVLVGAMVLVHGTELYTSAIVLAVLAADSWRRVEWRRLVPHALGAVVLAVVLAAPYLPVLLHWAGAGGAYQVGNEDGTALEQGSSGSGLQLLGLFLVDALGVDFPIRIVLVALGLVAAFRCRAGLSLVAVTGIFVALAVVATFFNGVPVVRTVFAATYPWSLPYRHLTFASIGLALIGGFGGVWLMKLWGRARERLPGVRLPRLTRRLGRLLVVTWVLISAWLMTFLLLIEVASDRSFTADDAAAMAWMRANVAPDAVVVNDTFADAGIWAPYKAGVRILFYRSVDDPSTSAARQLVLDNIGRLEESPEAEAAACALDARYVYFGAAKTGWQERNFPSRAVLDGSSALEEAFAQGAAAVYRIVVPC